MEEVTNKINEFVLNYNCNESIAGILRNNIEKELKTQPTPKTYYYVTDLCNPCETYWKKVRPDVKRPKKLLRKLFRGKQLHKTSSYWLSTVDDFSVYEGKIDGLYVGIPGVRGSIDYLIGKSIVDLKTKPKIPETPEEIFTNYPQDIEQVAFYATIHPENLDKNYLLFMEDTYPFGIKAFKIKIKDFGRIKSLILDRIKKLNFAFENRSPESLGRSRYHMDSCYLCELNLCDCEALNILSTESLKLAIDLSYDEQFTKKLSEVREKANTPKNLFTIWNLLAPREYYNETILGVSQEYNSDGKEEYLSCLRNLVDQLPFKVNIQDKKQIKKSLKDPRLYFGFKWLRINTSSNPEGSLMPYIIKVSGSSNPRSALSPNMYHLSHLGILTAAHGMNKGILFVIYPKLNDLIQVYEVNYQKNGELLDYIRELIDNIETSIKNKDISILPPNPKFIKSYVQKQIGK